MQLLRWMLLELSGVQENFHSKATHYLAFTLLSFIYQA